MAHVQRLVEGISRFQNGYYAEHQDLYHELAEGQNPSTLFITCSDSRVSPNQITDTRPGELFMIRNAGNMMPNYEQASSHFSGEGATVQYAVEVLNVEHIVVCGHTDCGAVKALLQPPEKLLALDLVHRWVDQAAHLRRMIEIRYGHLSGKDLQLAAIEQNVLIQMADLMTYPFVRERLAAGRLQLHGWVYHIMCGGMTAYDRQRDAFVDVTQLYGQANGNGTVRLDAAAVSGH